MSVTDEDLIQHLCTRAAMLMEDAIPIALFTPTGVEDQLQALEALDRYNRTIARLISAAIAIIKA